jgi:aminopeptidase N
MDARPFRIRPLGILICLTTILLNCAGAFGQSGSGDPFFPSEGDSRYDALHYEVRLAYAPRSGKLRARATIEAVPVEPLSEFSLDLDGLRVRSVTVNGERAHFSRGHHKILVFPSAPLQTGSRFSVDVRYLGHPGVRFEPGSFDGWFRTKDGAAAVGESNGTPTWLPCNNALADKASFDFHITVPADLKAIANGRLVGVSKARSRKTFDWREDEPMDAYLAVVDIGRGKLTRGKAVGVPTWTLVDPRLTASWKRRISEVPAILRFESKVFGPYPFDAAGSIVDRVGFESSLETQTRPIYDLPPWRVVLVHELAHQWFGDSVGLSRWRDIWLNEGFATWAQWFYNERHGGPPVRRVFQRLRRAKPSSGFWNPPPALPRTPHELFSTSVYTRGAMALEALRLKVGTSIMLTILREWATAHRYGSADTSEFLTLAEQVSGRSLRPLFKRWLFSAGKPS